MGGAIAEGNITPAAEFNIWADPEAAERVFASGLDVTMVGLDVTHKALMRPEHADGCGPRAGREARRGAVRLLPPLPPARPTGCRARPSTTRSRSRTCSARPARAAATARGRRLRVELCRGRTVVDLLGKDGRSRTRTSPSAWTATLRRAARRADRVAGMRARGGHAPEPPWEELVESWRQLDELGVESLWVADHLATDPPTAPRWTAGAACGPRPDATSVLRRARQLDDAAEPPSALAEGSRRPRRRLRRPRELALGAVGRPSTASCGPPASRSCGGARRRRPASATMPLDRAGQADPADDRRAQRPRCWPSSSARHARPLGEHVAAGRPRSAVGATARSRLVASADTATRRRRGPYASTRSAAFDLLVTGSSARPPGARRRAPRRSSSGREGRASAELIVYYPPETRRAERHSYERADLVRELAPALRARVEG